MEICWYALHCNLSLLEHLYLEYGEKQVAEALFYRENARLPTGGAVTQYYLCALELQMDAQQKRIWKELLLAVCRKHTKRRILVEEYIAGSFFGPKRVMVENTDHLGIDFFLQEETGLVSFLAEEFSTFHPEFLKRCMSRSLKAGNNVLECVLAYPFYKKENIESMMITLYKKNQKLFREHGYSASKAYPEHREWIKECIERKPR